MKTIFALLLTIALLLPFAAGADGTLALSETELTINKGATAALTAETLPEGVNGKKLVWTTSDSKVATVANGKVRAVGCGECEIVCAASEDPKIASSCRVTVVQQVKTLQIKDKKITVPFGASVTVGNVTIKPDDATDKTLVWTSSDESVCTVDASGTVTAVGAGDCEIRCTAADGSGKTAALTVHVPIFDFAEISVAVTESEGATVPIDLHGAKLSDVSVKSAGDKFFLCSLDREGLHIYPLAAGTAKVTLTSRLDAKDKAVCDVTVDPGAVYSGSAGDEPVSIVIVPSAGAIRLGDTIEFTYVVRGNAAKITNSSLYGTDANGRRVSLGNLDTKGKFSGKVSRSTVKSSAFDPGTARFWYSLTVADANGKPVHGSSIAVEVEDPIAVSLAADAVRAKRGEPFRVWYTCTGGSAPYTIALTNGSNTIAESKEAEGVFTVEPGSESLIGLTLQVKDSKNRTYYGGARLLIPVWDREAVLLDPDLLRSVDADTYTISFAAGEKDRSFKVTLIGADAGETEQAGSVSDDGKIVVPLAEDTASVQLTVDDGCLVGLIHVGHLKGAAD